MTYLKYHVCAIVRTMKWITMILYWPIQYRYRLLNQLLCVSMNIPTECIHKQIIKCVHSPNDHHHRHHPVLYRNDYQRCDPWLLGARA